MPLGGRWQTSHRRRLCPVPEAQRGVGTTQTADLTFDPRNHEYRLTGVKIPSVTQVLKAANLIDGYDGIPEHVLNYAAERGTAVHAATRYYDESDLDRDSLDPLILPYLGAWINFSVDHPFKTLASEQMYCGELGGLKFGMTLDRLALLGKKKTVIDIKTTREIHRSHGVQTAGYAIGLEKVGTPAKRLGLYRRMVVQLKPDGSYSVYEFSNPADGEVFAAALRIAYWKLGQ